VSLHQKLAGIKRKILSVTDSDSGFAQNDRKRFKGDDHMLATNKFDDNNNNDRRSKNMSGPLVAV
jgi:hypothetical protein